MARINTGKQLPLCFDLREASELQRIGSQYGVASEIPIELALYDHIIEKLVKNKVLKRTLRKITIERIKIIWDEKFGDKNNPFSIWPSWARFGEIIVTPCIYRIERDPDFNNEQIYCVSVKLPIELGCFYVDHCLNGDFSRTEKVIGICTMDKNLIVKRNEIRFHFFVELKLTEEGKYDLLK